MDLYNFLLFLGIAGLGTMAIRGFGSGHGHGTGHGTAGHGAGHGHGGHGHASSHGGSHAAQHAASHGSSHISHGFGSTLLQFTSPRVLFSVALGAGAFGPLLRPVMGRGAFLLIAALGLGIIFERAIVAPLWNLAFRFESQPAGLLESVVEEEGTAVTSFDKNGQGLIAVDVDGQVVQLLATLQPDDRALGAAVRAGDRVRIAAVDAARNRCTVSAI